MRRLDTKDYPRIHQLVNNGMVWADKYQYFGKDSVTGEDVALGSVGNELGLEVWLSTNPPDTWRRSVWVSKLRSS